MVDNTITLALEGDVSLEVFAEGMRHFSNLVRELTNEVASQTKIDWEIDGLQAGSAIATVAGIAPNRDDVIRVVEAYGKVGRSLERNEPIPFSSAVGREAKKITNLISSNITSVRFQTSELDSIIYGEFTANETLVTKTLSFGSITGRVQTISDRGSLKFTLYDVVFDKPVTCYISEKQKMQMPEIWGKLAIVSGLITRETTEGRAVTVRDISNIETLVPVKPGSYRLARGITGWQVGDEPAEASIRRIRNGED